MMNYYVPDFQMDDDCALPAPSSTFFTRPKKSSSSMPEEEVMELLWQNGQVVMQSRTQRSVKKSQPPPSADRSTDAPTPREIQSSHHQQSNHLSMQEDEMASWLHYPLQEANFDHDFCADLLYPPSATTCVTTAPPAPSMIQHTDLLRPPVAAAARPPIPPARRAEGAVQNFPYFTRHNRGRAIGAGGELGASATAGPSSLRSTVRESTVVDSCVTPATAIGSDERISETAVSSAAGGGASSGGDNTYGTMSGAGLEPTFLGGTVGKITEMMRRTTCDLTVTSSPGGSSSSAEPQTKNLPADDRKRKGREEDAECHSEDPELESAGTKKQDRGSSSIKRTRAAEVHNLSERRRRDRINEKMKALQELIPRCNKSDKASMLDEAIEYLKSLQLQVQVMSMGCSMVPMMFPGIQQCMPPMGMGMGMNRPMMPFHKMLAGAPLPNPAAAAHLGPRFPMPGFHIPPVPTPDSTRIQPVNQSGPMLGSIGVQNANQPRIPFFSDPYQQYLGMHQMQIPIPQNETMVPPTTSKPSTSRGAEDHSNHTSGR